MATLFLEFNDNYLSKVLRSLVSEGQAVDFIVTNNPELYTHIDFKRSTIWQDNRFNFPEEILKLNLKNPYSLSKEDIELHLPTEKLYVSITDRLCFYPKTVQLRRQMYYELLLFWKMFLREHHISHVVYPRVPHLGYGNVVYGVAKTLGIKTILVRDVSIDNKTRIVTDYLSQEKIPSSFAKGKKKAELMNSLLPDLKKLVGLKSSIIVRNISDNTNTLLQNNSGIANLFDLKTLKAVMSLIHWPFGFYAPSIFYFEKNKNWAAYYFSLVLFFLSNRKLWKQYKLLSVSVDLKKPYIYLGLHYQPERTSMPEGGSFENQLLMIDILSKALPEGCLLYVKEHPYQFSRSDTRQMNFRDSWYYEKISSYENVRLVKIDTPSRALLLNCIAAVTLTGSTGVEALVLGKPVITFTPAAWYLPCKSCYLVESLRDANRVMKDVFSAKSADVKLDFLKFLVFFQDKFIDSATESFSVSNEGEFSEMSISRLVEGLRRHLST